MHPGVFGGALSDSFLGFVRFQVHLGVFWYALFKFLGLAFRFTGATSESSMTCGFFVVFLTAQRANLAILGRFRNSRMSALSGFFCFYVMLSSSFKFWAQVTPKWSNSKQASRTWNARNGHFSKRKRSSGAQELMKNHKRSSTFRRLQLSGNGGNLATWSENMR